MPNVRDLDRSAVDNPLGWVPPPSLPVCEPTQVFDGRESQGLKEGRVDARRQANATRSGGAVHWPFLYSYRGNTVIINAGPRKSKYREAQEVGEAIM